MQWSDVMLKYTKIVDLLAVQTSSGLGIFRVKIQIVDKKLNFKNCFLINLFEFKRQKNITIQTQKH